MEHSFDIVDAHMHLGPYGPFHVAQEDAAGMIREMDRLGIRQGWISSHASISADALWGNDEVAAAVRAYPDRFLGFVVVDPNYPDEALPELERRLDSPEFGAIKIHPGLAQYPIHGPAYDPVWDVAADRGCPVLTHAWTGCPYCGPKAVRRVLERHPDVCLIFGHALFQATFEEAADLARDFENVLLDITTSNHCYGMIEHAVASVGAGRLLYGSDMPFISAAGAVGKVLYAQISDEDKARILGGNARRLRTRPTDGSWLPREDDRRLRVACGRRVRPLPSMEKKFGTVVIGQFGGPPGDLHANHRILGNNDVIGVLGGVLEGDADTAWKMPRVMWLK